MGAAGPTDKENQVKKYKKYCFRFITYLLETVRIQICIKQLDPDQIEQQYPEPYKKGLDLQH